MVLNNDLKHSMYKVIGEAVTQINLFFIALNLFECEFELLG